MAAPNKPFFLDAEGGEEVVETGAQPQTYATVAQGAQSGGAGQQQPEPSTSSGPKVVSVEVTRLGLDKLRGTTPGPKSSKFKERRTADPRRTKSDPRGQDPMGLAGKVQRTEPSPPEGGVDDVKCGVVEGGRGAKQARPQESSSGEEEDLLPEKKDARGRPVTTGKGVGMKARKKVAQDLKRSREDLRNIEGIIQGDYEPQRYEGAERRRKIRELEEQVPQLPTRDLVAMVLDHSSKNDEAARTSRNLKGTVTGIIRDGALFTRVAVDALSTRLSGEASEVVEQMREELASLKAQVASLLREKEDRDRRKMPPPPDPQPPGRNVTPSGETVREEERMEVDDTGIPADPPPPGKTADPPPPEKRTWDVVTPETADNSQASTSGRERSRARKKDRSSSRKRTKLPQTPATNSSPPSPHTPQKTGKSPTRKGETIEGRVDRKVREAFDQHKGWVDRRLQGMEKLLQTLVDSGA
ncbi:PREDICTED: uncharacterized protein LOC105560530, partial [Vollenhovia emeryi]|uniref:uncharacterized protein LOC105560530 n=1 Tax=Vollenhovia emeryi TaxID=411798 RepID=UPI0005F4FEAB